MHWDAVPVEEGSSPILAYRLQYKASTHAIYTAVDTELSAASRMTTVQVLVLLMVIVALLLRLDRIVRPRVGSRRQHQLCGPHRCENQAGSNPIAPTIDLHDHCV